VAQQQPTRSPVPDHQQRTVSSVLPTFTARTKNALSRSSLDGEECCLRAELAAFFHMKGSIQVASGRMALTVTTENPAVARRIFSLFKSLYGLNPEIFFRQKTRLKKNNIYLIQARGEEEVRHILKTLGRLDSQGLLMVQDRKWLRRRCCKKAFLRGAFLAGGYLADPGSNYHLELVMDYEEHARTLARLLKDFDLKAKIQRRKQSHVVYLKGSDAIASFLQLIGAHDGLLGFENTRVAKDMRNRINRLVNFETANLNKTVEAALQQLHDIETIRATIGLERLPAGLRPLAELRLSHPEASLQELGAMLNPPLSKSGVNHRFRKIRQIVAKLMP
jgi:cell division protein WhiA